MTNKQAVKNKEVVKAWLYGKWASNSRGTLKTDGWKLWSYNLTIGDTDGNNHKIIYPFTGKLKTADGKTGIEISRATAKHVRLAVTITEQTNGRVRFARSNFLKREYEKWKRKKVSD